MAITPYTGTFPNRISAGDNEAYATDVYNYLNYIDGAFTTTVNSTEANINAKEASVVAKEAIVVAKADEVEANAILAAQSAAEAEAAVATLPEGIISDSTTSLVDTWSSQKINSELVGKQSILTFDATPTNASTNPVTSDGIFDALATLGGTKQDTLISGVNIKTVNGADMLGSGDLDIASSQIVLLATINIESPVASVIFDTCFNSSYDDYIVTGSNIYHSSGGYDHRVQLKINGSFQSSNYMYAQVKITNSSSPAGDNSTSSTSVRIMESVGNNSFCTFGFSISLNSVNSTNTNKICSFNSHAYNGSIDSRHGAFAHSDGAILGAITGIKFFATTDNVARGIYKVYGIKKD